jgi:hypothetical protein
MMKIQAAFFCQWKRGIELAQSELIWITESDDYCSDNLLEELVSSFVNEGDAPITRRSTVPTSSPSALRYR